MASKLQNLSQLFGDTKTRTMIIFTGVVLFLGIIIAVIGIRKSSQGSQLPTDTRTVGAPGKIRSLPGLESPSEQYTKLQQQVNLQQAKQAQQAGTSAIPTLIGQVKKDKKDVPIVTRDAESTNPQVQAMQQQLQQQQLLMQQQQARLNDRNSQRLQAVEMKQQQQIEQAMANQARQLFSAWSKVPRHKYVQGAALPKEDEKVGNGDGDVRSDKAVTSVTPGFDPTYVKAGDVLFAVMTTAVNSDEPGPVMATIVSPGRLKGAKLMGSLKRVEKRVMIQFSIMSLPSLRNSIAIKAFAIDPDTARTALATDVNSHYLLRYGTLFAAAFLEGYAKAVETSGSTTTVDGSTVTQSTDTRTAKERLIMGLGQVGENLSKEMNLFNTPPTVKVASGTGLGVLFLGDIEITGEVLLPQGHPTAVGANSLIIPAFNEPEGNEIVSLKDEEKAEDSKELKTIKEALLPLP